MVNYYRALQKIRLGVELISNGDFSSSTNWLVDNGSSIDTGTGIATVIGAGRIDTTPANWSLEQLSIFTEAVNTQYRLVFEVRQTVGSGNFEIGAKFQRDFNGPVTGSFVEYSVDLTLTNDTYNRLSIGGTTVSDEFELRNVSVKQIL